MLSKTLIFTTLFALLAPLVSADDAAGYTINDVKGVVQCQTTNVTWTAPANASGPLSLYLFTDCSDDKETPIGTYTNIPAGTNQVPVMINYLTGGGLFVMIVDAKGNQYSSRDFYVGGSQGADEDACKTKLDNGLDTITQDLSAAAVVTPADGGDPTQTPDNSSGDGSLAPVANAANSDGSDTTTVSKITAGANIQTTGDSNGAGRLNVSPSTSIVLGLVGAGLLAFF